MESKTSGMSETQKRLFKLRMQINKGKKSSKQEVENEFRRFKDPKFDSKQRAKELQEEKRAKALKAMPGEVVDDDDSFLALDVDPTARTVNKLLSVTAEQAERIQEKERKKEETKATFGWQAYTQDASYRAYEKKLKYLPVASKSDRADSSQTSESLEIALLNGSSGVSSKVTAAGINRLSTELKRSEEERLKHSRRRSQFEADDVDYINDNNEKFNKKIKKAFDKFTTEIRQNLERGTAI